MNIEKYMKKPCTKKYLAVIHTCYLGYISDFSINKWQLGPEMTIRARNDD